MTNQTVKKLTFALALFLFSYSVSAQLVVNNGALIAIKKGAQVIVKTGAVSNTSGTIDNAGTFIIEDYFRNNDTANGGGTAGFYRVQGNWENNGTFIADSSQVELYGASQQITGTAVTEFHHLNLTGTGVKTQTIDAKTNSLLQLNDRELATTGNKMYVLNPDASSVSRTTGFVSSTGAGRLSREMNSTSDYLFPVGSSTGVARYRPVNIKAGNTLNNTFEVRMANVDATSENFNRATKDPNICDINPNYYHLIGRTQGSDPVQLTKFYDPSETQWTTIAHWQNQPRWENTGTVAAGTSGGFNTLTLAQWNDFQLEPFAFAINNPTIVSATGTATDMTCFGSNNGAIDVTTSGSGNFTYTWSPNVGTTQNLSGLDNGTYNLTITLTDNNNCSSTANLSFTIDEPAEIAINQSAIVEPLCAGQSNGSINITVLNTQGSTTYAWSPNGATTEDIADLAAGQYTVTVVDSKNCNKTATFTVDEPTQLLASLSPANISCFGETDGTIDASVSGGTPNYSYLWSNSQTTSVVSGLDGGTYAVTITDNNGCTAVKSVTLTVPDKLVVTAGPGDTIAIGFSANLSVDATVGGTPQYNYTWFNTKDNSEVGVGSNITVIPAEGGYFEYRVVTTDENGCVSSDTVVIRVDVNLYDFPDGFAPNGSISANQTFGIIASPVVELIEIKIFNRWGQLIFSGNGNNAKWDGTFKGEIQPMDTYVYQAVVQLPDGKRENKSGNVILVW